MYWSHSIVVWTASRLRCDWQRSEKLNLTNLSHCCGCCNCASRRPCKDRHETDACAPDLHRLPEALRHSKKESKRLALNGELVNSVGLKASFWSKHFQEFHNFQYIGYFKMELFFHVSWWHPFTVLRFHTATTYRHSLRSSSLAGLQIWRWLFQGPQSWLAAEEPYFSPQGVDINFTIQ